MKWPFIFQTRLWAIPVPQRLSVTARERRGSWRAGPRRDLGDLTKEAASNCLCQAWRVALVPWPRWSCGVGVMTICKERSEGSVRRGGLESLVTASDHQSRNSHVVLPDPCLAAGSRREPSRMAMMLALCLPSFPPGQGPSRQLGSSWGHRKERWLAIRVWSESCAHSGDCHLMGASVASFSKYEPRIYLLDFGDKTRKFTETSIAHSRDRLGALYHFYSSSFM